MEMKLYRKQIVFEAPDFNCMVCVDEEDDIHYVRVPFEAFNNPEDPTCNFYMRSAGESLKLLGWAVTDENVAAHMTGTIGEDSFVFIPLTAITPEKLDETLH